MDELAGGVRGAETRVHLAASRPAYHGSFSPRLLDVRVLPMLLPKEEASANVPVHGERSQHLNKTCPFMRTLFILVYFRHSFAAAAAAAANKMPTFSFGTGTIELGAWRQARHLAQRSSAVPLLFSPKSALAHLEALGEHLRGVSSFHKLVVT